MMIEDRNITRKEFIRKATLGITGLGLAKPLIFLASAEAPPADTRNGKPGMPYARLGKTGILVSRLVLGGAPLPESVLLYGIERGINFVHCSPGYGRSFDTTAQVLKKHRDKLYVALKCGNIHNDQFIDDCRRRLGIDTFDFLFQTRRDPSGAGDPKGHDAKRVEELKASGRSRFVGQTIHTKELLAATKAAADHGPWEVLMPQVNPETLASYRSILRGVDEGYRHDNLL